MNMVFCTYQCSEHCRHLIHVSSPRYRLKVWSFYRVSEAEVLTLVHERGRRRTVPLFPLFLTGIYIT